MITTRRITRDEVAREAGVSPATVSYVINNGPRPVSPDTYQKVKQAVDKLGYKPNAVARSLRMKRASILGMILPDTHNPYFAEVVRGVEQVAFEHGFSLLLCHSDYSPERELHFANVLLAERVAGVLWFPATQDAQPARLLAEYGVPLVILDRTVPDIKCRSVLTNNFRGGYLAAQHLVELGHRIVGCIARPMDLFHSQERLRGVRSGLSDYGITQDEKLIVRGGFRMLDGYQAAKHLFDMQPPPTAIFSYNDFNAIGALRAARECNLDIPGDISIIGFDDIPQAAFTCPSLTTIRQPKLDMGRHGAELLIELALNEDLPEVNEQPLEVELIVRESTGLVKQ